MTDITNTSANSVAVDKILRTLDDDLAVIAVCSCVSMKLEVLIKTLITLSDVAYMRNMKKEMLLQAAPGELSALEIKNLLKSDGWIIED